MYPDWGVNDVPGPYLPAAQPLVAADHTGAFARVLPRSSYAVRRRCNDRGIATLPPNQGRPLKPAALALVVCAIAAVLEGLAAGPGVKQRLAALRVPRWALPFTAWLALGGLYYVLCFIVLFRLLKLPTTSLQVTTLAATIALMAANGAWNYLFFRRANLYASLVFFLPYATLALALFGLLLRVDPASSAIFGPYLLYLVYATAWSYKVCQLNRSPANASAFPRPAA